MSILATCLACKGRFYAPDSADGKVGKCPTCGEKVPIVKETKIEPERPIDGPSGKSFEEIWGEVFENDKPNSQIRVPTRPPPWGRAALPAENEPETTQTEPTKPETRKRKKVTFREDLKQKWPWLP